MNYVTIYINGLGSELEVQAKVLSDGAIEWDDYDPLSYWIVEDPELSIVSIEPVSGDLMEDFGDSDIKEIIMELEEEYWDTVNLNELGGGRSNV